MTPDVLAGSVPIDGEPVPGNGGFNLQSALLSAADASTTASALSGALDEAVTQGGAGDTSDANRNEVAADQALLNEPNQDETRVVLTASLRDIERVSIF